MEYLSSAVLEITAIIMSVLTFFGNITSPSKLTPIDNPESEAVLATVVALADTQLCNYNPSREPFLIEASEDIKNSAVPVDALLIAGDVAENGCQSEYDRVYEDLKDCGVSRYIFCTGNHDIRLREFKQSQERFFALLNKLNDAGHQQNNTYYSTDVNGFRFIVIGSDKTKFEDAYISEKQLEFLNSELKNATKDGKPAFVLCHYPLKDTHGLPDTWSNSLWESGSIGKQNDRVANILNRYDNVFFITGHLHTGFGQYTYQSLGNAHGINLPSLGIKNKDGDCNERGIGYIIQIFGNKVVFRARNFATGEYLTDYDRQFEY